MALPASTPSASPPPADFEHRQAEKPYPWYAVRIWHGLTLGDWLRMLRRHGRSIAPANYGLVLSTSLLAPCNSFLRRVSEAWYRRRIEAVEVLPPLFVLGHWRSGTTLLHELLTLDERFTFASTYQCTAPHHFVLTERWLSPVMQFFTPTQRPMDAMPVHVALPQEDEFALCILGAPSPYLAWAFPEQYAHWPQLLDTEEFAAADRRRWQEAMLWFARRLSVAAPKRIVFKSPPHTARVAALREIFPQAQFLHIVRDPYDVFLSTVRTWRKVTESQWLETTRFERLEEQIFEAFERMYRAFERDLPRIGQDQLHEIRFEELVARPLEVMEDAYRRLGLEPFDRVRPKLEQYFADRQQYRKHEYRRDLQLERRIRQRWDRFFTRFGYGESSAAR